LKAKEIMKEIENMDNGERIKLLEMLYDKHFDNRPLGIRILDNIDELDEIEEEE
jgi:hypothetical protein